MSNPFRPMLAACLLVSVLTAVSPAADVDVYGDPLPPSAIARLGTTRLRDPESVMKLGYSPDGKSLQSLSLGSLCVWDAGNGKLVSELVRRYGCPLAVSHDGRTAAWKGGDGKLELLEAATGRSLHHIDGHPWWKQHFLTDCATFLPDGKVLATGGRDDLIRLWDVSTGKEIRALDNPGCTDFLACMPDGKSLVASTTGDSRKCRLLDLATGKVLRTWEKLRQPQALSTDGKILALGADGPQMRLWDVTTGKEIRRFDVPDRKDVIQTYEAARSAALSHDG